MDDQDLEISSSESTEVVPDRSSEKLSIRDALNQKFKIEDDKIVREAPEHNDPEEKEEERDEESDKETSDKSAQEERVPLVPPADMNKAEREAFLNPNSENAYVLQQYLNRRAYENRSSYQRKINEVEQLRAQTSSIYDTIKEHENDYAKQGISLGDIAKRSIAWDKAMQSNPIETAVEWLDSYGLNLNDLVGYQGQNANQFQQQPANYLTQADAERIAEEKFQSFQAEQQKNAVAYYNERVVESFVAAKPLFKDPETASQLEAEMAPIVTALTNTGRYGSPEEILETAYNYVVAGNPTFSSLNSAMTARPVIEQKQAAAQKAKAASRSISGSPGSGTPRMQIKDIRDNLRRRMTGE